MRKFISFIEGAFLGALVGSAVAMLLTPSSGNNLREQLTDSVARLRKELASAGEERRAELEAQLAKLREPLPIEPKN